MDIHKKMGRERKKGLLTIFAPLGIMVFIGYFVYTLIAEGFFIGWEKYFAGLCYLSILASLLAVDFKIIRWLHYNIYIQDNKLKIRDGFFNRVISIPLERIYYISSTKPLGNFDYDSLLITDKKIGHKKIKRLTDDEFSNLKEHMEVIRELKDSYPDSTFYYYRVHHHSFKFQYFFYLMYKNCEACKFSITSMDLVRRFVEQK